MKSKTKTKKKPPFVRQKAAKFKRLSKKWKKPKGRQSKMRRGFRGHRNVVAVGYGSPKKLSKLRDIFVSSIKDLENIKENSTIIIASELGKRKRVELLDKAKEMKLKISNIKDVDSYIKKIQDRLIKKREESKTKAEEKKIKKEEALKKKEDKEKQEVEKKEEEKKDGKEIELEKEVKKHIIDQKKSAQEEKRRSVIK